MKPLIDICSIVYDDLTNTLVTIDKIIIEGESVTYIVSNSHMEGVRKPWEIHAQT